MAENEEYIDDNESNDDFDFVDSEPAAPEKITLDDLARITKQGNDATEKLPDVFSNLTATLTQQQEVTREMLKAINKPQTIEEETEDQILKEFEDNIVSEGKGGKSAKKLFEYYINKRERQYANTVSALQQEVAALKERVVLSSPDLQPVAEKYGSEINEILSKLRPDQRTNPDIIKLAVNQVRAAHFDDEVNARVEAELHKRSKGSKESVDTNGAPYTGRPSASAGDVKRTQIPLTPAIRAEAENYLKSKFQSVTEDNIKWYARQRYERNKK